MIHELPRVNLLEAARRWKTVYDEQGAPVERYQVLDKTAYHKLQRELGRVGRELLDDFTRWQVLELGLSETSARSTTAMVWVSLYSTGSDPIQIVRNPQGMRRVPQMQLRSGLIRLTAWILSDTDSEPEDRAWARNLARDLMALPRTPKNRNRPPGSKDNPQRRPKRPKPALPPLTEDDVVVLREVMERRHARYGFRRPWARPVVGLWLVSAAAVEELIHVEREGVREALQAYEETGIGGLTLWGRRTKARVIPVSYCEDELRTLLAWPADWGTLIDVVGGGVDMTTATMRLRRELRETFIEAGILPKNETGRKISIPTTDYRRALAWAMYQRTRDWVTVQQAYGLSPAQTKAMVRIPTDDELLKQATT